jgi:signal transduction histidine kinase
VVLVALMAAGLGLVTFLERSLRAGVRTEALTRAREIALELRRGAEPTLTTAGDPEEAFVQVLGADGSVVVSSPNVEGLAALVTPAPGDSTTIDDVPFEEGPFLVASAGATTSQGPVTVVVGRSLEGVAEAARAVTASLVFGTPLLALLVGVVTWRTVGRALAPVERMRGEVEAISATELHRRVPDPPGNDEIARLAATMNRMLERLEQAQARQRRFVSDASHELRSPVASIRQHVELSLTHPETADLEGLAEVVLEENLRLQRIVEDLLLLSRIDEGTLRLREEPVDLDDLVLDEAARLRASTGLRIDAERVSAGRVRGDRERLGRLVRNLAENAARHARSAVALSVGHDGEGVILAVEDDGPGIPTTERERVFERFVRLDEARERDAGGSGLGLAIVREVARLHGGSATASEARLGGARLEVRLPAASG